MMTSHLIYSELDPDRVASLSPIIINDLLRGELGYTGSILTDDLEMGAITRTGARRRRPGRPWPPEPTWPSCVRPSRPIRGSWSSPEGEPRPAAGNRVSQRREQVSLSRELWNSFQAAFWRRTS